MIPAAFKPFFIVYLQRSFSYRIDALMWIINGLIGPVIAILFWIKVSESQKNLIMTKGDFVTYFLMLTVVGRIAQSWIGEILSQHIKLGKFSNSLIRPLDYKVDYLANDLAHKLLRLVTLLPFFVGIALFFGKDFRLTSDLNQWLIFLLSCILAYILQLFFQFTFASLAFFFTEIVHLNRFIEILIAIVNGSLIPLILLPESLMDLAKILFPRYLLSFPLEIILGQLSQQEIFTGFIIGIGWLLIFALLYKFLWYSGLKRYSAIGI